MEQQGDPLLGALVPYFVLVRIVKQDDSALAPRPIRRANAHPKCGHTVWFLHGDPEVGHPDRATAYVLDYQVVGHRLDLNKYA